MQVGLGVGVVAAVAGFAMRGSAGLTSNPTTTRSPASPPVAGTPSPAAALPSAPSATTTMSKVKVIGGAITPKSVVASGEGQVFAQNMMYSHTITVYDRDGKLQKTIGD